MTPRIHVVVRIFLAVVVVHACTARAPGDEAATLAARIYEATKVPGGLVVHLGCGDGRLTAALGAGEQFVVQGLDPDAKNVRAARNHIRRLGVYGRVSVRRISTSQLPYDDNLVKLVVVDRLGSVTMEEVNRILAPGGVAYVKQAGRWDQTVKPWPADIDQWTHYLHDGSNNAVAADEQVGPPTRLRWIAKPLWSRSHEFNPSLNGLVTGNGRMFYILDEGIAGIPDAPDYRFPARWSLVARDAFSGVLLWKRPIPNWGYREWNTVGMWSAPLTLNRRLVTDGDRVYMTFGYKAPLTVLDAATGETIRTIEGSEGTDEIVLSGGVLLLCVREQLSVASAPSVEANRRRRRNPLEWDVGPTGPAAIVAVDAESGKLLWKRDAQPVTILTLAALGERVCFHGNESIVCLDAGSGQQRWTTACRPQRGSRHSGGTLVMQNDVILFTGAEGLTAFSADTGKQLWTSPPVTGPGVTHPADLFVANGLVWGGYEAGTHRREQTKVKRDGRDPKTGEVKKTIEIEHLISPLHHFRCYRSKATERFLLLTKRGVEFVDLRGDRHMRNDWLRATCHYGLLPANGLLYVPPHHCFCYPGVKMTGFLALASEPETEDGDGRVESANRLFKGPAYAWSASQQLEQAHRDQWPTYRHDHLRSGRARTSVPRQVKPKWNAKLGGRLTQPVIAEGRLLVAQTDAHTIHALHAEDGRSIWTFTAGGRVDSPPTIYQQRVLLGCRDGWVYCLRAADGELVWRFRAAPDERQVVVFNQLESPWPVPGSVLMLDGIAYVAAGHSSFLDGGVHLYGLKPQTGELLCQTTIKGPWPDVKQDVGRPFDMEGTRSDILVTDGRLIYLFQLAFDKQLRQQEIPRASSLGDRKMGLHLIATGGFLDDTWYDRTYWSYSRRWPGFYFANDAPKAGQILVFDDSTTYGLHVFTRRARLTPTFTPGTGYELFADDNDNEPVLSPQSINREKGPGFSRSKPPLWSVRIPVRARGMVLVDPPGSLASGDTEKLLFLAGPPDEVPENDPYAAFEGRLGAKLWSASAQDGSKLSELKLDAPPVFDGLIAAGGRLYMSTTDGRVICFSK